MSDSLSMLLVKSSSFSVHLMNSRVRALSKGPGHECKLLVLLLEVEATVSQGTLDGHN